MELLHVSNGDLDHVLQRGDSLYAGYDRNGEVANSRPTKSSEKSNALWNRYWENFEING